MKKFPSLFPLVLALLALSLVSTTGFAQNSPTYDINTLAGKVASLNGTAGLQIRFSALIEQEADMSDSFLGPLTSPITPRMFSAVLWTAIPFWRRV